MKEKEPKENRLRQHQNESILDRAFWRGKWWIRGLACLPKEKLFRKKEIRFNGKEDK